MYKNEEITAWRKIIVYRTEIYILIYFHLSPKLGIVLLFYIRIILLLVIKISHTLGTHYDTCVCACKVIAKSLISRLVREKK